METVEALLSILSSLLSIAAIVSALLDRKRDRPE
jgi:hypothetical protein